MFVQRLYGCNVLESHGVVNCDTADSVADVDVLMLLVRSDACQFVFVFVCKIDVLLQAAILAAVDTQ